MKHPPEPTPEQCTANARVADFAGMPAYATWYPQMGGYVGKAVVVPDSGGCFEAYIWHDGEFPFKGSGDYTDETREPVNLHHCMAEQFIEFGELMRKLTKEDEREVP